MTRRSRRFGSTQLLQVTQQKIYIQAAFVRFVNNDGVVSVKIAVIQGFRQQNAICHKLDQATLADLLTKTDLEAHRLAQFRTQLLCHPLRHCPRRDSPWLGAANQPTCTSTRFKAELGQLRGFA